MSRQKIPDAILPTADWTPAALFTNGEAGHWFDITDESTHVIDPDGSRWATCQAGSGKRMGPVITDSEGRWCVCSPQIFTF